MTWGWMAATLQWKMTVKGMMAGCLGFANENRRPADRVSCFAVQERKSLRASDMNGVEIKHAIR